MRWKLSTVSSLYFPRRSRNRFVCSLPQFCVLSVEIMINTAYIRECILVPEKTRSVRDAISAGTSQYGMQTFDQSLWDLFQAGLVNYETALENASNADDFKLRMQGISSTSDMSKNSMQAAGFGR